MTLAVVLTIKGREIDKMKPFAGRARVSQQSSADYKLPVPRVERRRNRGAPPTVFRLHDCDQSQFAGIAADFGQAEYAYVVTPNVDHLIRYCDDGSFRALYRDAGFVLLDSRVFSRMVSIARKVKLSVCTGSDLTAQLLSDCVRADDPVVLIGGSATQGAAIAERFGLKALKHHCPPMGFANDPAAVEECLRFAEAHSPFRFCFIALGSPQQEFIANQLGKRGVARGLALCVGASINFLTGAEVRAPRWIQQMGFEWAFRLMQNPTRLAHRYLVRGPRIFMLLRRLQIEIQQPLNLHLTKEVEQVLEVENAAA
jgi:exopolysaccharide biosynthesis WecB/TagA/CpsF family protein